MSRTVARIAVTLATTLIAACCLHASVAVAADRPRPPNIILILIDDMGWREVGFMGNTFVETPQIDALAKKGLVFTQAYASAPNCAPLVQAHDGRDVFLALPDEMPATDIRCL